MRLEFETRRMMFDAAVVNTESGTVTQWFSCSVFQVMPMVRKYQPLHWRIIWCPWLSTFFSFLGTQNDYLFPGPGRTGTKYPFDKPHWWRTRIGFKTAWELTCIIYNKEN